MSPEERFWTKVAKGPGPDDHWLWTAAVADDGYGRYTLNASGRTVAVRPHRYAFHLVTGRPLDGFGILMHECDVPICVRATTGPDTHVVEGTTRANMLDRRRKGRDRNGTGFRWRGLARDHFTARSRALRDEVRAHGWTRPERIAAFIADTDPDAPTLSKQPGPAPGPRRRHHAQPRRPRVPAKYRGASSTPPH